MPNLPISGLTASASNAAATDVLPVVQTTGTGPVKMTVQQMAGGLLGSTTLSGATITADAPVLNMSQTWNNSGVTFTGLKFNATDTASAAASLLMDLQVGGVSQAYILKGGTSFFGAIRTAPLYGYGDTISARNDTTANRNLAFTGVSLQLRTGGHFGFTSGDAAGTADLFLTRRGAANLRLGAADAAAPVAQTLSVQSVVTGTTNIAGANLTITGSQGTGTGAGGSIIFQVAPAGSSGSAQNALATALTIDSTKRATFAGGVTMSAGGYFVINGAGGLDVQGGACNIYGDGFWGLAVTNNNRTGVNTSLGFAASDPRNPDTFLFRDAANTLALRNGNEGQTFRLYGRFTDITNDFERFFINAPTTSGAAVLLGTQKGATTGAARALEFQTNGTTRLTIPSNGGVWTTSGEYFHFRASANTSASVLSPADGVMTLGNWNADNFNRLQFGGTSSAFPALKRVSANLQVIAADGTSSAGLIVGNQALATTATDGFLYVPTCPGTPTGTPTTQTGTVPIVVDATNNKLYFYSNAAWRDAGP